MNSTNFVNECFDIAKQTDFMARELSELSFAFFKTGNPILGCSLADKADRLTANAGKIRSICSSKTSEDLKEAQKMSGTILKSCLATVGKE